MTQAAIVAFWARVHADALDVFLGAVCFEVAYVGTGLVRWAAHR